MITDFQIDDKGNRPRFFWKPFLVANIKVEVILGMLFLKINNPNMAFGKKTLIWKSYTINKDLLATKQVQLVDPKEFVIAVLDANSEIFIVHVAIRKREEMPVHSPKQAQVGVLLFDKALTKIPAEYSNYSNIFSAENVVELPEYTRINDHAIELEEDKQLLLRAYLQPRASRARNLKDVH